MDSRYTKGRWGIEHWDTGLNFWIPWPNYGNGNYKFFLEDSTGHVGINTGTPSYNLDVNGDIQLSGTVRYSSDERLKTDIKDLEGALEKVKLLKGVSYKMKPSRKKNYDLSKITDPLKLKTIQAEFEQYDT